MFEQESGKNPTKLMKFQLGDENFGQLKFLSDKNCLANFFQISYPPILKIDVKNL